MKILVARHQDVGQSVQLCCPDLVEAQQRLEPADAFVEELGNCACVATVAAGALVVQRDDHIAWVTDQQDHSLVVIPRFVGVDVLGRFPLRIVVVGRHHAGDARIELGEMVELDEIKPVWQPEVNLEHTTHHDPQPRATTLRERHQIDVRSAVAVRRQCRRGEHRGDALARWRRKPAHEASVRGPPPRPRGRGYAAAACLVARLAWARENAATIAGGRTGGAREVTGDADDRWRIASSQPRAVTVGAEGGDEEVEFFGDGALMYGCRHVPKGPATGGLLVCSPILADFGANYQREVRLGRRLAACGIAVQRFHPYGVGQSDGEAVELTLDSMIEDARAALELLIANAPTGRVAVLGTRFGALAASAVAHDLDGAPLVLWEPTVDPRRFFREGLRARAVHLLKGGAGGEPPADELARRGFIDLLGLPVGPALFDTPSERGLIDLLGRNPRPVLLIDFGRGDRLRDDYANVAEQLAERGHSITAHQRPVEESWWFVHDRLSDVDALIDTTVDWLRSQLR